MNNNGFSTRSHITRKRSKRKKRNGNDSGLESSRSNRSTNEINLRNEIEKNYEINPITDQELVMRNLPLIFWSIGLLFLLIGSYLFLCVYSNENVLFNSFNKGFFFLI